MAEKPAPETNRPTLTELRATLSDEPDVDPALSLIAGTDPEVLRRAVTDQQLHQIKAEIGAEGHPYIVRDLEKEAEQLTGWLDEENARYALETTETGAIQDGMAAALYRDNTAPTVKQLEALFHAPDTSEQPQEGQRAQEILALRQRIQEIRDRTARHEKEVRANEQMTNLALDIVEKRERLSRPLRVLGTLACGFAFAAAGDFTMAELLQGDQAKNAVSAAAASASGVIGATMTAAILGRENVMNSIAHRRAKRKIRK